MVNTAAAKALGFSKSYFINSNPVKKRFCRMFGRNNFYAGYNFYRDYQMQLHHRLCNIYFNNEKKDLYKILKGFYGSQPTFYSGLDKLIENYEARYSIKTMRKIKKMIRKMNENIKD